jgi:uncharacterized membrane protein
MLSPTLFRKILWTCFYLLCAFQLIWYVWWVPPRLELWIALCLALIPLLPGLLLKLFAHRLAIVWAGFGVLLHFTFSAMEAVIGGANRSPAIVASFICAFFFMAWNFAVLGEKRGARMASK